jgi:mono/diheme cytochrome c family protein
MVPLSLLAGACGGGSSVPDELSGGRKIYGSNCATCHGGSGQGGAGPALGDVMDTWPSCTEQQEWIALGSERWKTVHGPTYGADDTPITAVMPGHEDRLSEQEIAEVAAYQRVEFGGGDLAAVLADCGLPAPSSGS